MANFNFTPNSGETCGERKKFPFSFTTSRICFSFCAQIIMSFWFAGSHIKNNKKRPSLRWTTRIITWRFDAVVFHSDVTWIVTLFYGSSIVNMEKVVLEFVGDFLVWLLRKDKLSCCVFEKIIITVCFWVWFINVQIYWIFFIKTD